MTTAKPMPKAARLGGALAALALSATVAAADAPAPRQPVDLDRFVGRWYEIARTPNANQPTCSRLAIDVRRAGGGRFEVVNTCARPNGGERVVRATAMVLDTQTNTRLRFRAQDGAAGLLGVTQEFWVLDRASDYRWAILGTPGGNYFWLWSREHSPADRALMLRRVRSLGYDTNRAVIIGG